MITSPHATPRAAFFFFFFSSADCLLISVFFCLYCSMTNFVCPSPAVSRTDRTRLAISRRMKYIKNKLPCRAAGPLLINNDHFRSQPIELCKAIFSEAFISRFLWTALIYHEACRYSGLFFFPQKQTDDIPRSEIVVLSTLVIYKAFNVK